MSKEADQCRRYFAIGKKMPKGVKRHCGMCRQHGILVEVRGHCCIWKNCHCAKCLLIRQRRKIMSTQIRLRRAQDKFYQRTSEPNEANIVPENCSIISKDDASQTDKQLVGRKLCYICQKCKNHGILVWKKEHKRHCQFANCRCQQCELIDRRRELDHYLKSAAAKPANTENKSKIHVPIPINMTVNPRMVSPISETKAYQEMKIPDANFSRLLDLAYPNINYTGCVPRLKFSMLPERQLSIPLLPPPVTMQPTQQFYFPVNPQQCLNLANRGVLPAVYDSMNVVLNTLAAAQCNSARAYL